ncbi:MAG: dTDP-4-dehydrorhamnose reductase [Clostridiaceae bacterium]|jgi:dTDP-4-dehydrorhamnose reductase|nr:dTDP-4-dehydrorhamnose reductase [Clostridiaceae bacterium]
MSNVGKSDAVPETRVLVTGAKGQLGSDVVRALVDRGVECLGADLADFDITDAGRTMAFIKSYAPTAVVHCAAYTAVDKAEDEPEICERINATGTANIAAACRETGASMIYISTDYVFPGTGDTAYETDDPTGALSVYGRTKRMGEEAVLQTLKRLFIVRVSWVFGPNGNNFVNTMLRLGSEREELRVVGDQIGSPTYTRDLSELLCEMLRSDRYGIYHATNEGICSWAGFARAIMERAGLPCQIVPIRSEEYPTKAVRPKNSRLSKKSLTDNGFRLLPPWEDALGRYLDEVLKE